MNAPVISIFEVGDYDRQIANAAGLLRDGGVIVLPTETVYGAAGVLTHDKAVARLKTIRQSSGGNSQQPLTIHLARREQAMRYLGEVGEIGRRLMTKLWPGPVALEFAVPGERRAAVAKELGISED